MNKSKVLKQIKEQVIEDNTDPDELSIDGLKTSIVYEEAGFEGGGEDVVRVIKVEGDNSVMFVECTGFYTSYEGTYWSYGKVYEVEPKEVVVTKYFKIK